MSNNMLGEALREISGPLKTFFERLSGEDRIEWLEGFKRFLRKEDPWQGGSKLLKFLRTVAIPVTEKFVTKDNFMVDTSDGVAVKISYVSINFYRWFGDKIEEPIEESRLCSFNLQKFLLNSSIIEELGGEEKVETTLAEMFYLMSQQGQGQEGVLITNGYVNIFYIRDAKGVLRTVFVRWRRGQGWNVDAHFIDNLLRCGNGLRAFSH